MHLIIIDQVEADGLDGDRARSILSRLQLPDGLYSFVAPPRPDIYAYAGPNGEVTRNEPQ